ncbi:MAG TPA: hypothetical protein VFW65_03140 [Pseudonocardiaceae bacterium]|nr:hypothetical protein [Pseudonocardiaceae bacterium]
MLSPSAYGARRRQRRWSGLMYLALGGFLLLGAALGGAAFTSPAGLVLVLPVAVCGYCCARAVGAARGFRRALADDRKEQRVR